MSLERAVATVARYPITALVAVSETAFLLGGVGAPPAELWLVLLLPAYVAHVALAFVFGPYYWLLLAVTVTVAFALDRITQRLRQT
ncbi:MAG: hypothetical protein Q8P50_11940 [Bacillota bacterium]|nr:hypothetical protein [Bacillota bacterium]